MVRRADDEDDTNDHDDQFLSVDKFPSERIAKESEAELTDDVADVRCCVDSSSKKERVGGSFLVARAWETAPVSGKQSVSEPEQITSWNGRTRKSRLVLPS